MDHIGFARRHARLLIYLFTVGLLGVVGFFSGAAKGYALGQSVAGALLGSSVGVLLWYRSDSPILQKAIAFAAAGQGFLAMQIAAALAGRGTFSNLIIGLGIAVAVYWGGTRSKQGD
jgi:hypothetical protein